MASRESPSAPVQRSPTRLALWSIIGFWLFYLAVNTVRMALADMPGQLDMLGRRMVVTLFGMGLTGLLYLLLQRRQAGSTRALVLTVFAAALPLSIAYAAVNYVAFYVISPNPRTLAELAKYPEAKHTPLMMISDGALNWYFFIVAWGVLWIALAYAERVRHAERQAARYRAEAQSAELRALRYQVNPHFLFNTLNSLSALVLAKRNADAERMIINLSTFFRTSLSGDPAADVPLVDEIAMQKLYLGIEAVRFPKRLVTVIDVPDDLGDVRVPGLILQPLVENAIKYGVAGSAGPVTVAIRARSDGSDLRIIVEDDGPGANGNAAGFGVGLRNVCDRLAARFGARARCEAGVLPGGGYRAVLTLPLHADLAGAGLADARHD